MKLPSDLLDEFAKVTHDPQIIKENTTFYGTAKFNSEGDFVLIDGATTLTPATFATNANDGDRVIGTIKNHRAIVTANVTNPAMTLGVLKATTGVIVEGYLTTNAKRTKYDDQTRTGLTFSAGGMGANGGTGHYWYITNTGEFHAEDAYVKGKISASSGYIGDEESGFTIDKYGIFSGTKSGVNDGFITLGNQDFKRAIGGKERELLRFAIGANFGVTAKGELYANSANITGEITATSGKIGNFDINGALYSNNKKTIDSSNPGVYLGDQGIALGADSKFKVTSEGVLTAKEATIDGVLTAKADSKIGPWNVSDSSIWKGANAFNNASSLYFGDDGLSIKQNFIVTSAGSLTAKVGKIGNWTIGNSTNEKNGSLYTTGKAIGSDGSIFLVPLGATANTTIAGRAGTDWVLACGSKFGVTNSGDIYASGGRIGKWTIANGSDEYDGSLHTAAKTLGADGGIYLIPKGTTSSKSIAGRAGTDWVLACGSKFGVTNSGYIYASNGKIGPLNITTDKAYTGNSTAGVEISYGTVTHGGSASIYYYKVTQGGYVGWLSSKGLFIGEDSEAISVEHFSYSTTNGTELGALTVGKNLTVDGSSTLKALTATTVKATSFTVNGHTNAIGARITATNSSAITVGKPDASVVGDDGTRTLASISMPIGTWAVSCTVTVPKGNDNTYAKLTFRNSSSSTAKDSEYPVGNVGEMRVQLVRLMQITTAETYYFRLRTGTARTIAAGEAGITAVRIA